MLIVGGETGAVGCGGSAGGNVVGASN